MVYILLAPGFEEAEALVPADLLRRAGIETALVSLDGAPVPGGQGICVTADLTLDDVRLDDARMVVLPGGGVGVKNLGSSPKVEALVRDAAARGLWLAAICAAPSLFSLWGLLDGRRPYATPPGPTASPAHSSRRTSPWLWTATSSPDRRPVPASTSV